MSKTFKDYLVSHQQQPRAEPEAGTLQCLFKIAKSDQAEQMVFGWASIADRAGGDTITDHQGDIVEMDELEAAAYDFVRFYREGSEMHERGGLDIAVLIESMVFTQQKLGLLGIPQGTLPYGWWVGFKVLDDNVWQKVVDGTYKMFSIEGQAVREKV